MNMDDIKKLFESGPLSFLKSRKAWVSLAVIATAGLLFYFGKLQPQEFTELLKYVFTVWVGSMAVEKGAKAIGQPKKVEEVVAGAIAKQLEGENKEGGK
jgi:hypothetical protein